MIRPSRSTIPLICLKKPAVKKKNDARRKPCSPGVDLYRRVVPALHTLYGPCMKESAPFMPDQEIGIVTLPHPEHHACIRLGAAGRFFVGELIFPGMDEYPLNDPVLWTMEKVIQGRYAIRLAYTPSQRGEEEAVLIAAKLVRNLLRYWLARKYAQSESEIMRENMREKTDTIIQKVERIL